MNTQHDPDAINLLPLSEYLMTPHQVRQLLAALEHLKSSYFQKQQQFTTTIQQEIPYPLSQIIQDLARGHGINLADVSQAETFLTKLSHAIENIPHLSLTIAVSPTMELIKEINHWIISNLGQVVILEFAEDETIIAGAKIAYKGKIVDQTLKKRLEFLIKPENSKQSENQITRNPENQKIGTL